MEENQIKVLIDQIREENEIERTYLKKQLNMMKALMAAMAGIFLLLLIAVATLVPQITTTLNSADAALEQISGTMTRVDEVFDSVKNLVAESEEGISMIIDSMESIDFEGLNRSIEDLGNVVSPLADFFSRFQ